MIAISWRNGPCTIAALQACVGVGESAATYLFFFVCTFTILSLFLWSNWKHDSSNVFVFSITVQKGLALRCEESKFMCKGKTTCDPLSCE